MVTCCMYFEGKFDMSWCSVWEKQVSKMIPKFLAFKNHSEQEETLVKWLNIGSIYKYHLFFFITANTRNCIGGNVFHSRIIAMHSNKFNNKL